MRGFPPLEMAVLVALFAIALLPLVRLTGANASTSEQDRGSKTPVAELSVYGELRFAHRPTSVSLRHGSDVLVSKNLGAESDSIDFEFNAPLDGCELSLDVQWSDTSPETAVEILLEPEGIDSQRTTLWGREALSEFVSFSWSVED